MESLFTRYHPVTTSRSAMSELERTTAEAFAQIGIDEDVNGLTVAQASYICEYLTSGVSSADNIAVDGIVCGNIHDEMLTYLTPDYILRECPIENLPLDLYLHLRETKYPQWPLPDETSRYSIRYSSLTDDETVVHVPNTQEGTIASQSLVYDALVRLGVTEDPNEIPFERFCDLIEYIADGHMYDPTSATFSTSLILHGTIKKNIVWTCLYCITRDFTYSCGRFDVLPKELQLHLRQEFHCFL